MSYLYFELNESPDRVAEYRRFLRDHASAVEKSVQLLLRALHLMMGGQTNRHGDCGEVVFTIARHAAEELDAVCVLVEMGCIEPCKSHLRSAFEADLSVRYILEAQSDKRSLAYRLQEVRDWIRLYEKADPNSSQGQELWPRFQEEEFAKDILSSWDSSGFASAKRRLEDALEKPPFEEVNDEWKRIKKLRKRNPAWHALFGGPTSIRDLALHLNRAFWYEFVYANWSRHTHAANSLHDVAQCDSAPWAHTRRYDR